MIQSEQSLAIHWSSPLTRKAKPLNVWHVQRDSILVRQKHRFELTGVNVSNNDKSDVRLAIGHGRNIEYGISDCNEDIQLR